MKLQPYSALSTAIPYELEPKTQSPEPKPNRNPIPAKPSMLWPADLFPHIAIANGGAIEIQRVGQPRTHNRQFMLPVLVYWLLATSETAATTVAATPATSSAAAATTGTATMCQMTFAGPAS